MAVTPMAGETCRLVASKLPPCRVGKQDLLQLSWTTWLAGCVLLQLENLDPSLFAESFMQIEEPQGLRQGRDGGLQERMALHRAQPTHRAYAGWGVTLDLVARERLSAVLDAQH